MKLDTQTSFLEDALNFASQKERYHVADALACHFHNTGQSLAGNTEANDREWLARNLWERYEERRHGERWDNVQGDDRDHWIKIARAVIAVMPTFQLRIADRLIEISKVLRDIERAERAEYQRLEKRVK